MFRPVVLRVQWDIYEKSQEGNQSRLAQNSQSEIDIIFHVSEGVKALYHVS